MENKIKLLILFIFIISGIYSQKNTSLDSDCLLKNSARLSQAIFLIKGEEFVSNMLENDQRFVLLLEINNIGNVIEIMDPIRGNYPVDEEFKNQLMIFFQTDKTFFYCCSSPSPELSETESFKLIEEERINNPPTMTSVVVGFPGELLSTYRFEKKKQEEKGESLSKVEFLQKQIEKYID